jgi:hypothetical protein
VLVTILLGWVVNDLGVTRIPRVLAH